MGKRHVGRVLCRLGLLGVLAATLIVSGVMFALHFTLGIVYPGLPLLDTCGGVSDRFFALPPPHRALPGFRTFYISLRYGHDGNNGTGPAFPWQTMGNIVNLAFSFGIQPGDTFLFCRGDVHPQSYVHILLPSNSFNNPVQFSNYDCRQERDDATCGLKHYPMPRLSMAAMLPQPDPKFGVGWVPQTANPEVLVYDLNALRQLTGSTWTAGMPGDDDPALWINGYRYVKARWPNYVDVNRRRLEHSTELMYTEIELRTNQPVPGTTDYCDYTSLFYVSIASTCRLQMGVYNNYPYSPVRVNNGFANNGHHSVLMTMSNDFYELCGGNLESTTGATVDCELWHNTYGQNRSWDDFQLENVRLPDNVLNHPAWQPLILTLPQCYSCSNFAGSTRVSFVLEDRPEFLDAPGEWFHRTDNGVDQLWVWPRNNADRNALLATAPADWDPVGNYVDFVLSEYRVAEFLQYNIDVAVTLAGGKSVFFFQNQIGFAGHWEISGLELSNSYMAIEAGTPAGLWLHHTYIHDTIQTHVQWAGYMYAWENVMTYTDGNALGCACNASYLLNNHISFSGLNYGNTMQQPGIMVNPVNSYILPPEPPGETIIRGNRIDGANYEMFFLGEGQFFTNLSRFQLNKLYNANMNFQDGNGQVADVGIPFEYNELWGVDSNNVQFPDAHSKQSNSLESSNNVVKGNIFGNSTRFCMNWNMYGGEEYSNNVQINCGWNIQNSDSWPYTPAGFTHDNSVFWLDLVVEPDTYIPGQQDPQYFPSGRSVMSGQCLPAPASPGLIFDGFYVCDGLRSSFQDDTTMLWANGLPYRFFDGDCQNFVPGFSQWCGDGSTCKVETGQAYCRQKAEDTMSAIRAEAEQYRAETEPYYQSLMTQYVPNYNPPDVWPEPGVVLSVWPPGSDGR